MIDAFALKDCKFPEGFLWGSATAAHQIEGDNIHSSNWHYEQECLKKNPNYEVSGKACNHYNMVEQDTQLLLDLGHQAYRMGVEWARIEPAEGVFVQEEVDHYLKELALLKEKGLKVFVTLVHFTVPQWFAEKGAFMTMDNLVYFERYLNFILPQIAPYVDYWNVINEFNLGTHPDNFTKKYNSVRYHARGYHLIKQYSNAPVSSAHALVQFFGKRQNDKFDKAMESYMDVVNNEFFFHAIRTGELVLPHKDGLWDKEIKDTADFWSINTYVREMVDTRVARITPPRYSFTETRMLPMKFYLDEFNAECIYHHMMRLTDKPIFITENGCSCYDDDFRIVYLAEYLCALNEAIRDGADVRGYLYWSLMDNYEWSSFIPKFGLVGCDFKTFERTPKPSAYFYKDIIESNGFSQEILRKYLKEMPRVDTNMPIIK